MTSFADTALGLSGQGKLGLLPDDGTTTAVQNTRSTVTPTFCFDADIPDGEKRWYPMRIAHGRPERAVGIKTFLDQHQVQNFLPMTYRRHVVDGKSRIVKVPAIHNLIFIRSVEERLTEMKRYQAALSPLRYMMWHSFGSDTPGTIITIPETQMDNFIRVASIQDDRVMFLGNKDFSNKIGRRVRITDGPFAGVVGTVYRVKKDRRVVVTLDNIASVAISYINPDLLEEIE